MRTSVFLALLILFPVTMSTAAVTTFDDLVDTHAGGGTSITNAYQGLVWSNFAVGNAILQTNNGLSGYYYGMITPSNITLNGFGYPAEIYAASTNFNFSSAYLTGAWRSNLNIQVQGF